MMKHILIVFILSFFTFGNLYSKTDSLKKFTYGLQLNPFTYSKWSSVENEHLLGVLRENKFFDITGGKSDTRETFSWISNYTGIFFGHSINQDLLIETGIMYSYEQIIAVRITEILPNGNKSQKSLNNYKLNFIQLPIRIGYKFWDDEKHKKRITFFSAGVNFDFVFIESNNYGYKSYTDSNGNIIPFSQEKLEGNGRDKIRFNKISPFVYIGREQFNNTKTFSFRYGSMLVLESIYQKQNTGEFLKNYKVSPLIIGLVYHF